MTSEVVVMNRLGIALASDSAATVYVGRRPKLYHADKLFMLSHYHPIGVMVYGNSALLGVPWETILKLFRAELGRTRFDTLQEYAAGLIDYLNGNHHLFPLHVQRKYYLMLLQTLYAGIHQCVTDVLLQRVRESGPENMQLIQADVIDTVLREWRAKPDLDVKVFDEVFANSLADENIGEIQKLVVQCFPGAGHRTVSALHELARLVVIKDDFLSESLSGLVIAGFGDQQYFPVMQEYAIGEVLRGRLRYKCVATYQIDADTPSIIKPFAQSDMVRTFLNGIDPVFEYRFMRDFMRVVVESPDEIIEGMPGVGKLRKNQYKEKVRAASREVSRRILAKLRDYRHTHHLQPILRSVGFLPKNELAHVASSLVNLSSFQKRMSISEDETVGGPVDVAVISKGDGFVWIERKHYFKPGLNRHFFRNHAVTTARSGDRRQQ